MFLHMRGGYLMKTKIISLLAAMMIFAVPAFAANYDGDCDGGYCRNPRAQQYCGGRYYDNSHSGCYNGGDCYNDGYGCY